jgi:hypothetical protein
MHGNLRRFLPEGRDRMELEVAPGTTIEALLGVLGAAAASGWLPSIKVGGSGRAPPPRPPTTLIMR